MNKNFIRDVINTAVNFKYLYNTIKISEVSDIKFREEYSEYSTIARSKLGFTKTLYNVAFGQNVKQFELILKQSESDEFWFFINGIMTTKEVASVNELALENIFGVEFSSLYNPTHGFVADILECVSERTFDQFSECTQQLYDVVDELLESGKKVRIIAHSQGGIILSNFLKLMKQSGKRYSNIEVFTFASAADEDILVPGVYQEHFGNENDFVARMGLMSLVTMGDYYIKKDGDGHLLNQDHLEHFKEGKYCKGKSRLFEYIKK